MKNLIETLIRDEGLRLKPYKCTANKLTIGVGRNIEDRGITREEAMFLLKNDINICKNELTRSFYFYKELDVRIQEVLINMCFNIGLPRLLSFKKTLKLIEKGDYEKASIEMLDSKWARQVGDRAIRLSNIVKSVKNEIKETF